MMFSAAVRDVDLYADIIVVFIGADLPFVQFYYILCKRESDSGAPVLPCIKSLENMICVNFFYIIAVV